MKNLEKSIVGAFIITSLFGLFSCEQEEVQPKVAKSENKADVDLNELVYKRHYITKRGSSTMEYDANYRLQKVNLTPNLYVQYEWYTENGNKFLSAKRYMGGKLIKKEIYSLNASNKAMKSVTSYYTMAGALIKTEIHGFEYFSNTGKLKRIYNTDPNISEQTTFDYSGDGIRRITYLNQATNVKKFTEYWYTNTDYPTRITDKYHFNAELENLDFYPRIFGSFSKHLPVRTRLVNVVSGNINETVRKYKYTFNQNGYVINRKTMNALDNSLVYSEDYDYLVVIVSM